MKTTLIKHKIHTVISVLLLGCIALISTSNTSLQTAEDIAYPEGFRTWTHVKTGLIQAGNPGFEHWGGFHHIYANAKAVKGYKTGKFLDGSVIVFDVIEASPNSTMMAEGKRKLVDVMVRNTKLYSATGGWGYEEFTGDSKTDRTIGSLATSACYNCHATQKTNDNVFSQLRD